MIMPHWDPTHNGARDATSTAARPRGHSKTLFLTASRPQSRDALPTPSRAGYERIRQAAGNKTTWRSCARLLHHLLRPHTTLQPMPTQSASELERADQGETDRHQQSKNLLCRPIHCNPKGANTHIVEQAPHYSIDTIHFLYNSRLQGQNGDILMSCQINQLNQALS
jgi:hypothetical protein